MNEKYVCRAMEGSSYDADALRKNPALAVDYIVAPPRMGYYIKQSAYIYDIYMQFVSPEDIHVYSIDEVFMDVTPYLKTTGLTAREFAMNIIQEVLKKTGITATVGIGTNLYLAKVAMDIGAKHIQPDENGVRIAELDEMSYRRLLWEHRPLTDFWRVGRGYTKKLEENGLFTMGDIARCSIGKDTDFHNEELLYKLFGINAELLIDHAWGWEPCTIADIKAYKPENNSMGSGQVLHCPYSNEKAKIVLLEMADQLSLDLVEKGLVTDQLVLTIGYDRENLKDTERIRSYTGKIKIDHYGRAVPRHAQGTISLGKYTSSSKKMIDAAIKLFEDITNEKLLIRRINMIANHVVAEDGVLKRCGCEQLNLFTDYAEKKKSKKKKLSIEKKRKNYNRQCCLLSINLGKMRF
ncbi:DNA polymerase V [[Clostridium] lactatifermentans DSM 14214]|uniref:DNA polymerase V n=1 Tax=Anaerotignum lactatifermentans DSM 14214 TaxID=1121323 RepID=A0A1M7BER3_9FIRM|nr:DNA methylase [Anaerotignum lactatifermentans]SHL53414.1 DNA polymerase V [[Clostridium] lactatifermentans DSM 14214] [Anaerotignum lactatifermentans DSM 14214]